MSRSKTNNPKRPKRHAVKTRCTDYSRLHPDAHIDRIDVEILTGRSDAALRLLLDSKTFPPCLKRESKAEKRRWRFGDVIQFLRSFLPTTGGRTNG